MALNPYNNPWGPARPWSPPPSAPGAYQRPTRAPSTPAPPRNPPPPSRGVGNPVPGRLNDPAYTPDDFGTTTSPPNGGWSPSQPGSGTVTNPPTGPVADPVDFMAMARALYPWLPEELLQIFASAWDQYGDPEVALGVMRQSPSYERYFPGNRTPDGRFRLSEQEYFSTLDGYRNALASYDLNPEMFNERFVSLIQGDVSPNEFAGRLSQAYTQLINFGPEGQDGISYSQRYYADVYGLQMSDAAVFLDFIDPDLGQDVLNRRVSVAQVGGGALAYGFNRSAERVRRLVGMGLTGDNASRFYAGAAAQLPLAQTLARRFNNREGVDVGTLEDAQILGDAGEAQRLQRNVTSEVVSFNRQATGARDQQGRVFGLEQQ